MNNKENGRRRKRITKRHNTTIALDRAFKEELDKIRDKYYFGASYRAFTPIAWPRCPTCNGLLIQKFNSKNLICTKCGKEYELTEVR